jgi:hypothetical protein
MSDHLERLCAAVFALYDRDPVRAAEIMSTSPPEIQAFASRVLAARADAQGAAAVFLAEQANPNGHGSGR